MVTDRQVQNRIRLDQTCHATSLAQQDGLDAPDSNSDIPADRAASTAASPRTADRAVPTAACGDQQAWLLQPLHLLGLKVRQALLLHVIEQQARLDSPSLTLGEHSCPVPHH
mmetsp:Transcript_13448/g.23633  ORF Transcript_13448/g.23633 Transcript_13448/m.23633 type:complete len:112 (+) Transcript_13448:240-575(+)